MFYETLQQLLRAGELRTPELDNQNRRLHGLPSQVIVREAFIADRVVAADQATWDANQAARRLFKRIER
jgi:hypothetical protein